MDKQQKGTPVHENGDGKDSMNSLDELLQHYPIHGPVHDIRSGNSAVHELFRLGNQVWLEQALHRGIIHSVKQFPTMIYDSRVISQPVWNVSHFEEWPQELLEAFEGIRGEALAMEEQQWVRNDTNECYSEFVLYRRGVLEQRGALRAPQTVKAVQRIPEAISCLVGEIGFLALPPGCEVPLRCGMTNYRLTAHLALQADGELAGLEVAGENIVWREGELLVFDDSFEHRMWNRSNRTLIVLQINYWHPGIEDAHEAIRVINSHVPTQAPTPQRDEL